MGSTDGSILDAAEIDSLFDSAPPSRDADDVTNKLREFILLNNSGGRKVVCGASGGTTVPLEQRCVCCINNFSSGHRGAASAEGTCQPYCRSLPEDPFLECLESTGDDVQVCPSHLEAVKKAIADHHAAIVGGQLLKLPFSTIFEYLQAEHKIQSASGPLDMRLAQVPKMLSGIL